MNFTLFLILVICVLYTATILKCTLCVEIIEDRTLVENYYIENLKIRSAPPNPLNTHDPVCHGTIEQKCSICHQVIHSRSSRLEFVRDTLIESYGWMCEKKFVNLKMTNEVVEDYMLKCIINLKEEKYESWPYYISFSRYNVTDWSKLHVFGFLRNKTGERNYYLHKYYVNLNRE